MFDTASIEVDRSALYTVADPDDLLHREPLVGWFRVRGPPADQALHSRWLTSTRIPTKRARRWTPLAECSVRYAMMGAVKTT